MISKSIEYSTLEIIDIGEEFKNDFNGLSKKITLIDLSNNREMDFFLHKGHRYHFEYWDDIENFGSNYKITGKISSINVTPEVLSIIKPYKIMDITFPTFRGDFVILKHEDLLPFQEILFALNNGIYRYKRSSNYFDPNDNWIKSFLPENDFEKLIFNSIDTEVKSENNISVEDIISNIRKAYHEQMNKIPIIEKMFPHFSDLLENTFEKYIELIQVFRIIDNLTLE